MRFHRCECGELCGRSGKGLGFSIENEDLSGAKCLLSGHGCRK